MKEDYLLTYGLNYLNQIELDSLTKKYGFVYRFAAYCVADKYMKKAIKEYNMVVMEHLDSLNGKDWFEKHKKEKLKLMKRKMK